MNDSATAGLVVIGNEILTGKVVDVNSAYLSRELNALGMPLLRITTIGDEFEEIGTVVKQFSEAYTWVFTSGGIGPTHDDITIPAIAAAFGVEAVSHPALEEPIRRHYGARLTEDHLLMALVPEGSELLPVPGLYHPQVKFHNVFILPGVPQLFQAKFAAIKERFRGRPVVLRELFLKADEGVIAGSLRDTAELYPGVLIGSYPDFFRRDYSVKITLEAHEAVEVDEATAYLRERLLALSVPIVRTT